MKIRGKTRDLTIIYIPEANRPIRRANFSRYMFYCITSIILLVITALIVWQSSIYIHSSKKIRLLNEQLYLEKEQYKRSLNHKDGTIESLQMDILHLSQQAEKVKIQMNELKVLEAQLRNLSNGNPQIDPLEISDAGFNREEVGALGLGGEAIAPSEDQIQQLIAATGTSLFSLEDKLHDLSKSLTKAKITLEEREKRARRIPSIWPTQSRTLSSGYGIRKDPFTQQLKFHSGIDISGNINDLVFAAADGVIESIGSNDNQGNFIRIDHANGLHTLYMHLSKITVSIGDSIEKGEEIGLMGSTGRSTGNHLHYEVHKNEQQVNPMDYIP